jgi:hypothetical protein
MTTDDASVPGTNGQSAVDTGEPLEAVPTFREQADGRKVGRLPGGKVVLVDLRGTSNA